MHGYARLGVSARKALVYNFNIILKIHSVCFWIAHTCNVAACCG